jgi:hypothetical protein
LSGCLYGNKEISVNLAEEVFTSAIQILRNILGTDNTENEGNSVADIRENDGGKNGFLIPEKNSKKGKSVNEIEFFQLTAGSQGKAGMPHVRVRTQLYCLLYVRKFMCLLFLEEDRSKNLNSFFILKN